MSTSVSSKGNPVREHLASRVLASSGPAERPAQEIRSAAARAGPYPHSDSGPVFAAASVEMAGAGRDPDRAHGASVCPPGRWRDAGAGAELYQLRRRRDRGQGLDGGDHRGGVGEREAPRPR